MEALFGKLPEFFKDEDELHALWRVPEIRRMLLWGLTEMQKIIDAEKSDLFDVLAHAAYGVGVKHLTARVDTVMGSELLTKDPLSAFQTNHIG